MVPIPAKVGHFRDRQRFSSQQIRRNPHAQFPHKADQMLSTASWVWLPNDPFAGQSTRFLRFRLSFDIKEAGCPLSLRVSADQRFQLWLDGRSLGEGPDRSDIDHWSLHEFADTLPAGGHELEVLVWYIAEDPATLCGGRIEQAKPMVSPPMAQMSWRGGFYCEGTAGELRLDTGEADWKVCDLTNAVTLSRKNGLSYHDIGPAFHVDMRKWGVPPPEGPAAVCVSPDTLVLRLHGVVRPGWKLLPTSIPPQRHELFTGGRYRSGELSLPVTVPPNTEQTWIWDTDTYVCGYPDLAWSGGEGSDISVEWAESYYHAPESGEVNARSAKGNRDEVEGKVWLGFGDSFCASGTAESPPVFWWRSGRYLRIQVKTGDTPLTLERVALRSTGYPLDSGDAWRGDAAWEGLLTLCRQTLSACAHETWVDCPYYEQLMYVADTRLHMMAGYLTYPDDRLSRRCMDLFDWSHHGSPHGMVAERYPSAWRQESGTFAMIFVWMLRDYLYWRDDADFVCGHLPTLRQLLERFLALCHEDGRMGPVPGWPFVDWVNAWPQGCGPGVREGDSSILNLQWVLTLQAAAQIESAVGEAVLAERCLRRAEICMDATLALYWSPERGLLLDTADGAAPVSEHAQTLALLTRLAPPDIDAAMLRALEERVPEVRCTYYYRAYLLEAFYLHRREEAFHRVLEPWLDIPRHGFRTVPEKHEPTRSDCHAWSAHPLFHTHASIAGIRSLAPGFQKVSVRPLPGPFASFESVCVHPRGEIRVKYHQGTLDVSLPEGVELLPDSL